MSQPLDQLIKQLAPGGPTPSEQIPTPAIALAVCQQVNGNVVNADGTLNVTFDAQNIVAINLLDIFDPIFGMNVLCLVYGTQAFALGPYTPGEPPDGGPAPVGTIVMYGSDIMPDGNWLICDGSEVSRSVFPLLFNRYGTTWGVGDGVSTFNLPNQVDFFPIGAGGVLALGQTGGTQTITAANMPSHTHSGTTGTENNLHTHGFPDSNIINSGGPGPFSLTSGILNVFGVVGMITDTESAPHGHAFTTGTAGSGTPYLPPAVGLNFIIRVR